MAEGISIGSPLSPVVSIGSTTTSPARSARRASEAPAAKSNARKPRDDLSSLAILASVADTYRFHAATDSGHKWAPARPAPDPSNITTTTAAERIIDDLQGCSPRNASSALALAHGLA